MKIEYIREFIVLAELNNYTLASQKLYIAQSALSRHMSTLEENIGAKLIQRTTHDVKLTENGQKAYEVFKKITNKYDSLCEELKDTNNGLTGLLRLGMLYYSIRRDYGRLLPICKEKYPDVKIECTPYQPHIMYQAILNGSIDIGIVLVADYIDMSQLVVHKVISDETSAMLLNTHPLAKQPAIRMSELTEEKIILLKDDYCYTMMVMEAMERCGFTPKETVMSDFLDTVPFTIQETNGVHINGSSLSPPNYDNIISVVPITDKPMRMPHGFAYRKDNQNPVIPRFIELVDTLF